MQKFSHLFLQKLSDHGTRHPGNQYLKAGFLTTLMRALADGEYKLTESAVVVEYLDKKYGKPGKTLLPDDPEEFGKVGPVSQSGACNDSQPLSHGLCLLKQQHLAIAVCISGGAVSMKNCSSDAHNPARGVLACAGRKHQASTPAEVTNEHSKLRSPACNRAPDSAALFLKKCILLMTMSTCCDAGLTLLRCQSLLNRRTALQKLHIQPPSAVLTWTIFCRSSCLWIPSQASWSVPISRFSVPTAGKALQRLQRPWTLVQR